MMVADLDSLVHNEKTSKAQELGRSRGRSRLLKNPSEALKSAKWLPSYQTYREKVKGRWALVPRIVQVHWLWRWSSLGMCSPRLGIRGLTVSTASPTFGLHGGCRRKKQPLFWDTLSN